MYDLNQCRKLDESRGRVNEQCLNINAQSWTEIHVYVCVLKQDTLVLHTLKPLFVNTPPSAIV